MADHTGSPGGGGPGRGLMDWQNVRPKWRISRAVRVIHQALFRWSSYYEQHDYVHTTTTTIMFTFLFLSSYYDYDPTATSSLSIKFRPLTA